MQYLAKYIRLQGFIMESPSGEAIGVWYSRIESPSHQWRRVHRAAPLVTSLGG